MKPTKGLYLDCLPEDQPEGTYRDARNILVTKLNSAVANEDGFNLVGDIDGDIVLHAMPIDNGEYVIWAVNYQDSSRPKCRIARMRVNRSVETVVAAYEFNFSIDSPIKAVYIKNFKGEIVIAWTDNVNPPRIMNIDNLPFKVKPELGYITDKNMLVLTELFPRFNPPILQFRSHSDSGGMLKSGAYWLTISYETPDRGYTNWGSLTGPFMISDDMQSRTPGEYDGCEPGSPTSKCIEVEVNNIDTRYKYYRVAVMKRVNGNYEARYIGKKFISGTKDIFLYTGTEVEEPLILDELLQDNPSYKTAKTITLLDDRLHLANLTKEEQVNFQQCANNIKTKWITDYVSLNNVTGSFKDEVVIFNKRSFMPDEVYAFYVAFHLDNGARTGAFHIPGRAASDITYGGFTFREDKPIQELVDLSPGFDYLKEDLKIDKDIKFFHTRETARANGDMGFWENELETYPDNEDWDVEYYGTGIGGHLQNQKVRHHKFPGIPMLLDQGLVEEPELEEVTTGTVAYSFYDTNGPTENIASLRAIGYMMQMTGDLSAFGTWDEETATYTATAPHPIKISGSFNLEATAQVNGGTQGADCYSSTYFTLTRKNGVFETIIAEASHSQDDPYAQYGSFASTSSSSSDSYEKLLVLEAGEQLVFDARAQSVGDTCSANVALNIKFEVGVLSSGFLGTGVHSKVLGLKLYDIYIPESIRKRVKAIEVLYAKRNFANMLVVANSALFHYQFSHTVYGENLGAGIGSRPTTSTILDFSRGRFHAFDLMKDLPSVVPNYLKVCMTMTAPISREPGTYQPASAGTSTDDDKTPLQAYYTVDFTKSGVSIVPYVNGEAKRLRAISDFSYIPGDTSVTIGGTTMDNTWGEEHAYFKIEHPDDGTNWGEENTNLHPANDIANGFTEDINIVSLYQHHKNLYTSMFNQELVSTNVIKLVSDVEMYTFEAVFGGDTHINRYGIRLTSPINLNGTKSTNKFEAVKAAYMFPVYSVANADLRHEGKELKDSYYPKVGHGTNSFKKWIARAADAPNSNTFFYNHDYTVVNDLNKTYPFNRETEYVDQFPGRIIRSKIQKVEEKGFSLRIFPEFDYYEMPKHRGIIVNIEEFGGVLFINMEKALFKTVGNTTLSTSTIEVTLGTGDIFRMPPQELIPDKAGYAGCQHITSCMISKAGYFFVDSEQGKIFLVRDKIEEISNAGLRDFFYNNAGISLSKARTGFPIREVPNMPAGVGYAVGFDEKYNRILFTKKDFWLKDDITFIPEPWNAINIPGSITFNGNDLGISETNIIDELVGTDPEGNPIYAPKVVKSIRALTEEEKVNIFDDTSFTYSYSLSTQSWTSRHDYVQGIYLNGRKELISIKKDKFYIHNEKGIPGKFVDGITYPSTMDLVFNPYPDTSKVFTSLDWRTRVFDKDEVYRHTETFSSIMLWDSVHCSGEIPLVYFGNIRNVEGAWRFNAFRDLVKDSALPFMDKEGNLITSNIDADKDVLFKGRFIDNYIIVRWIEDNLRKNTLYLYSIDANNRVSFR